MSAMWLFLTMLSRALVDTPVDKAAGTAIGDMIGGGGLAAAFDGNTSQTAGISALKASTTDAYAGKSWSSKKVPSKAVVYSASDVGWTGSAGVSITINFRVKTGLAPTGPTDGTIIATTGAFSNPSSGLPQSKTLTPTAGSLAYDHWFIEIILGTSGSACCAEVQFYELL
jgi:hypothetical protein